MPNEFEKIVEDVGHDVKVVFEDVFAKLPNFIVVAKNVETQAPTVVVDVTAVVKDAGSLKLLVEAIVTALANKVLNITDDAAVITQFQNALPIFEKIYADMNTLVATLSTDFKIDVTAAI